MDINLFDKPTAHPYGLLRGYTDAFEKESALAFCLVDCINASGFVPVEIKGNRHMLVADGLLKEVGENKAILTKRAIGLLYSHYGKS